MRVVLQHPGPLACVILTGGMAMAWRFRPVGKTKTVAVIGAAYLFADFYMAVLHMFLDHEQNATHSGGLIRDLAECFQQHHAVTTETFTGNHMLDIDFLVSSVIGVAFAWHVIGRCLGKDMPHSLYLWAVFVCVFGELAIFNHSKMHARVHLGGEAIPTWTRVLQDWGLLLHPAFHRVHHTVFVQNFSFLVGFAPYYDAAYRTLQALNPTSYYDDMQVLFWAVQPHTITSLIAVLWITFSAKPGQVGATTGGKCAEIGAGKVKRKAAKAE